MQQLGLTGGIASGKSLVSKLFETKGVPVIDADVIAREVVAPGSVGWSTLHAHFGDRILTPQGALDRAALRQIVFSNADERRFLNATLHPLIRHRAQALTEALALQAHAYLIHAIPLLVETGQQDRFYRVIVVDVPESLQLARLQARDGSSLEQAKAILAAQASREQRLAIADHIIDNAGSREQTQAQIDDLHQLILDECKGSSDN